VAEVLTEVYLPVRLTDPVTLLFHPNEVVLLAHLFEFSVYGEIKDLSGKLRTIIKAIVFITRKVLQNNGGLT